MITGLWQTTRRTGYLSIMKERDKLKEKEFAKLAKQETDRMLDVMCSKSADYADDKDKLFNFKQAGRMDNITPIEALRGMWLKHRASIQQGLDELLVGKKPRSRDWWIEKLTDDRNYNLLLFALLEEQYFIPGGTSSGYPEKILPKNLIAWVTAYGARRGTLMQYCTYGGVKPVEDNKPMLVVCEHVSYDSDGNNNCGWYIANDAVKFDSPEKYMHKDLRLHPSTGKEPNHSYGEAPGYYPTKEIAEAYVKAYEEKNDVARQR